MIWLRFRSPVVVSLFAVLIGLAAGLIIHTGKLPALNGLVEPVTSVGTLWLNCLRVVVIPMIVVFLISALVSHGDVRTTGKVGGGAFVLFCVMLAAASLFAGFFTTPLTRLVWGGGEAPAITAETAAESAKIAGDAAKAKVPGGTAWIRTLVPTNLFKAALEDDLIGLMLFAAMFAFALKHTSGEASQTVVRFFQGLSDAMSVLVQWIQYWMPIGLFALTLSYTATLGVKVTHFIAGFGVVVCGLLILFLILLYPVTAIFGRVSMVDFARAALPVQVTAIGTRSSIACLPDLLKAAEQRLGLDNTISRVALPLAVSIFKANRPLSAVAKVLFCAHVFGIAISPTALLLFGISVSILSFSTLGVPMGGGAFKTMPLYLAIGLPIEAVVMLEPVEVVADIIKTVLNVTANLSVTAILGRLAPAEVTVPESAAAALAD